MIPTTIRLVVSKLQCLQAGALGSALSTPVALIMEGDWLARAIIIFGAGGTAAVIIALGRLSIYRAQARKTDAETTAAQFIMVIERLQEEVKGLSNRLEVANQREALVTVSKHDALKNNQAMLFYIRDIQEIVAIHNVKCPTPIELPKFRFVPLGEILGNEDEERRKFATAIRPVIIDHGQQG